MSSPQSHGVSILSSCYLALEDYEGYRLHAEIAARDFTLVSETGTERKVHKIVLFMYSDVVYRMSTWEESIVRLLLSAGRQLADTVYRNAKTAGRC